MGESEGEPPKDRAIQSLQDSVTSFRAAVGHGEDYFSRYTDRLPFSVRMLGALLLGVVLNEVYDSIAGMLSEAAAYLTSASALFTGIEVSVVDIILWIFYLVLVDIAITIVGINRLAREVSSMEEKAARSDGGEAVERRLIPKWTWILFVVLHAGLGASLGQPFGTLGVSIGLTVGAVVGDELYRRARDGSFFGLP